MAERIRLQCCVDSLIRILPRSCQGITGGRQCVGSLQSRLCWPPHCALAVPVYAQDVIKIAAGAPLTGPLAKQGQEVANAVKLAVEEWNAKGGVLGKKIVVMEADDQGNPQIGVAAAEKVAADAAVMGSVWGITSVTCIPPPRCWTAPTSC